ncbi:hypothetical protein SPAN111604_01560 [Sphingomonas antarctica]|uniref:hypothetical protein n=1 Tax=Sphingomonas antarctica TaxID=2040274 RepID=UPI0039E91F77
MPTKQAIVTGTLVAGTLDLLSAFVFSAMPGGDVSQFAENFDPAKVLRGVASGPFGDAMAGGGAGAAMLGLVTHYVLMMVIVTVFVLAAKRIPYLTRQSVTSGLGYGLLVYLVMYWIVLANRFPGIAARIGTPWGICNALVSHLLLVGLPIGMITARELRRR